MGNRTKEDELYREMCRVVVKLCWKCAIWGRNQSILLSQAYYVQH
ncbi:TPA: DUF2767 family protein [Escherichia coli]|nr:DUF2767 family protein [Escherichia coli]